MKFPLLRLRKGKKTDKPMEMANALHVDAVRCVVIGDSATDKQMMLKKYAAFAGVPYDSARGELVTAFNGRKCVFVESDSNHSIVEPHVFLLCVSVARQSSVEEKVKVILNTVIDQIRGIPFVLVGTQIEKRLEAITQLNGHGEVGCLPMPLHLAESFAKQIGASKYIECSETTGEGLDEVFEEAFDIGHAYVIERQKGSHRRKSLMTAAHMKSTGCITQ
ncbi:hypothetical protein Q1695_011814 [Nippostrongylus brasiliensis]|nr:hypothetical protein Q1695_011814 [Nippostrongylus brasiliensis]